MGIDLGHELAAPIDGLWWEAKKDAAHTKIWPLVEYLRQQNAAQRSMTLRHIRLYGNYDPFGHAVAVTGSDDRLRYNIIAQAVDTLQADVCSTTPKARYLTSGGDWRLQQTAKKREALIEGLLDGTIDCIATDHAPHPADEKENPFAAAPFGVIGLETAFAACHTELVLGGRMSLGDLVLRMSTVPARIFGLPVPTLAEGAPANLAVVDTGAVDRVGDRPYASKSTNAAFAGVDLTGRVVMTLAGGQDVYRWSA